MAAPCRVALRLRFIRSRKPSRNNSDTVGFEPLLAVDDIDPHPLPGPQAVDAAAAQSGDVDEDVLAAAIGGNEPVAFVGFKPLHRAFERGRRARRVAIGPAGLRRHDGAGVDVQHIGDERSLGAGADFAGDQGTLADVIVTGAAQGRHRQKGVLRAVGQGDETKSLAGVEPFHRRVDATAGGQCLRGRTRGDGRT